MSSPATPPYDGIPKVSGVTIEEIPVEGNDLAGDAKTVPQYPLGDKK